MSNTPKPCDSCHHLYYDAMNKDDPESGFGCWINLRIGDLGCKGFKGENKMTKEPKPLRASELFYVGYREIFEKPGRKGYTKIKEEAGKFTLESAKSMTEFNCSDGVGRWYIACSALDSFDGTKLNPTELY